MSLVLGIDSATPDVAVAVCERGGEALAEHLLGPGDDGRPRHGTRLLPTIEQSVDAAGGWDRIGLIAVGVGPGSFTGLRIGIATARALAQARGLPIVAVSSPAALAAGIAAAGEAAGRPLLAVIDARRREVFAALSMPGLGIDSASGPRVVGEPVVCLPEQLTEAFPAAAGGLAAGDGSIRFRSELQAAGIEVLPDDHPAHRLRARHVCILGAAGEAGNPEDILPRYLRKPDAERWRERDRSD